MRLSGSWDVLFLAGLMASLCSCTTYTQMAKPLTPVALAQVQMAADGVKSTVYFDEQGASGVHLARVTGVLSAMKGQNLQVVTTGQPVQTIPLSAVRQVTVTKRLGSTLTGMTIGLLAGFIVPVVGSSFLHQTGEGPGVVLLEPSMVIGTLGGMLIGAAVGHRTIFRF